MNSEIIPEFYIEKSNFTFHPTHVFSNNGNRILINSKLGTIFVCDDHILNQIKSKRLSDDIQFKLIQRGFASISENDTFKSIPEISPKFFIIDVTRACNLRCSYCFRNLDDKVSTISAEMLEKIIEYVINYAKQNRISEIHIQPWGGEPLIAFDRIAQMHRLLNESNIKFQISVETNGCLVTKKMAERLNEMNIGVGVSLDGLPITHNSQRPTMSDGPSYNMVYRGIKNLWDAGYKDKLGIVTVLTQNNKKYFNDILDFYTQELKINKFKLNIVKDSPNLKDKNICLTPDEYAELQLNLLNKLIKLNKAGYKITEFNIRDKLLNLLVRGKMNICISQGCLGGIKLIGFDQTGHIYPCDLTDYPEFSIGTIEDGDLISLISASQKTNEFFNPKHSPLCTDCAWWFYCKGGCTSALKYRNNKIEGVDKFECNVNRKLYPVLLNLIENESELLEPLINTTII